MQLSIVVPVYGSAECLPELAHRAREEVGRHFESYELILINDDSPDESWEVIVRLTREHDFEHRWTSSALPYSFQHIERP